MLFNAVEINFPISTFCHNAIGPLDNPFQVVKNRLEKCFAVQCSKVSTILLTIVELELARNRFNMLNNIVDNVEQCWQQNIL